MEVASYHLSPAYTQHLIVPKGATFLKVLSFKNDLGGAEVHLYMLQDPFIIERDDLTVLSVGEHMTLPPTDGTLEYLDSILIEVDASIPMTMHLFMERTSA